MNYAFTCSDILLWTVRMGGVTDGVVQNSMDVLKVGTDATMEACTKSGLWHFYAVLESEQRNDDFHINCPYRLPKRQRQKTTKRNFAITGESKTAHAKEMRAGKKEKRQQQHTDTATAANTNTTTGTTKNKSDTMLRNGDVPANTSTRYLKDTTHQRVFYNSNFKGDTSDSGAYTNGHKHNHTRQYQQHQHQHQNQHQNQHQHQHQHQQQQQTAKHRKPRNSTSALQDGSNSSAGGKRGMSYSVDGWLGVEQAYSYERRYMSSCGEDKLNHRQKAIHRNSVSSDATVSDDLNSSSSNEDATGLYITTVIGNKHKQTKSRQKRQQRRKKHTNSLNISSEENSMDIDDELKENQRPNHNHHSEAAQNERNATINLRKQCITTAAFSAINNKHVNPNSKHGGNVLIAVPTTANVGNNTQATSYTPAIKSDNRNTSYTKLTHYAPSYIPSTTITNTNNNWMADGVSSLINVVQTQSPPLRQYIKLNMMDTEIVEHLLRYVLDPNLLRVYGYPVESAIHEGCIEIYKCLPKTATAYGHHTPHHHTHHNHTHHYQHQHQHHQYHHHQYQQQSDIMHHQLINTNDGLYTNVQLSTNSTLWEFDRSCNDSGQGSGDSSTPSVDSDSSEVCDDEPTGASSYYTPDGSYQIFSQYDQSLEKQCVRCKRAFHVTEWGEYLNRESCVFHWGKLNHVYVGNGTSNYQYSCCNGDDNSIGCSNNSLHVWTGAVVGLNGPYKDFVYTVSNPNLPITAYALDCEMSFTGRGLEVTKVTVVSIDGELVYEHFVRPPAEIVDYNTRFSGITEDDLYDHSHNVVKTLEEVQIDLLELFHADTILIGHALENDLRVLRIVHKTVIDTSIVFPHNSGFPYKRALKHLTKVCLNRDIQCEDSGHSSFEDSRACLELMLWKIRKDMRHELS